VFSGLSESGPVPQRIAALAAGAAPRNEKAGIAAGLSVPIVRPLTGGALLTEVRGKL